MGTFRPLVRKVSLNTIVGGSDRIKIYHHWHMQDFNFFGGNEEFKVYGDGIEGIFP